MIAAVGEGEWIEDVAVTGEHPMTTDGLVKLFRFTRFVPPCRKRLPLKDLE